MGFSPGGRGVPDIEKGGDIFCPPLQTVGILSRVNYVRDSTCPTSHFPEDKTEISIYLSWDKDFISLAKEYSD